MHETIKIAAKLLMVFLFSRDVCAFILAEHESVQENRICARRCKQKASPESLTKREMQQAVSDSDSGDSDDRSAKKKSSKSKKKSSK